MTARNQPHKYRCETCAFRKDQEGKVHLAECHPHGSKITYNLYNIDFRRTSTLGCASHSDAVKAEQRIADVISIDEIMGGIEQNGFYTGYREPEMVVKISDVKSVLEEAIALLRGKEE